MYDLKRFGRVGVSSPMAVAVTLLLLVALPCLAQHPARLTMKGTGGQTQGIVRYLASSRSFEIKTANGITQTVKASDVAKVELAQQPAGLQKALNDVNSGNYQAAIPVLKEIAGSYVMLGPDVIASQALALAYLRTNRTKEALKICEDLQKMNPSALNSGSFAKVYWEALLAENRTATLRTSLRTAIETGSREVAAAAQVVRGDLEMQANNPREALLDGYLRTILLFQDVAFIQPEALFKAIKAHEALNEVQYAERWRKRLLANYGTSEFAGRLQ